MTSISLPPFLMTSEKGSFARKTIKKRKPVIIDRILSHFDYTPAIRTELHNLKSELNHSAIQPLREDCSDSDIWHEDIIPWLGKTWLEVPWFLAEAYFYRRVLECVKYFQNGPWLGKDPYQRLKDEEIQKGLQTFTKIYEGLSEDADLRHFQDFCSRVLWSNRGDLSNLTTFDENMGIQSHKIILNQSAEVYAFLSQQPAKIAYIFDNVGKELYFDLAFMAYLLHNQLASSITCYLKNQPFFVSDTMPKDFWKTVDLLRTSTSENNRKLAQIIIKANQSGILQIEAPPFFVLGRMFRSFPDALNQQMGAYDLVILKGDVNYRRLMGDRHWAPITPVKTAAGYFPTSFLSFRTLKAEIIVGLSKETVKYLETEAEDDWLINGDRGMITFLEKPD